jgi:hypothetical protein
LRDGNETLESIFDRIRNTCARVANQASRVWINYDRILPYASSLPLEKAIRPQLDPNCHYLGRQKDTVAFLLVLDCINFGSGYFPYLHKRPGRSGYFTIASSLYDFYRANGALAADQLAAITAEDCMRIFDQDPANTIIMELMAYFSAALNQLGRYLLNRFNGSFTGLVEAAGASAGRLVRLLKQMPYFNDVAPYAGLEVPFFKRAQIIAADLAIAFQGRTWGCFSDLEQMTIFADNLVPHVLRMDGILRYEDALLSCINAQTLIPAGSAEEVEIRACAVHAVELIKKAVRDAGQFITAPQLDNFLWNRGQQPRYKAVPRHRTRTVFY